MSHLKTKTFLLCVFLNVWKEGDARLFADGVTSHRKVVTGTWAFFCLTLPPIDRPLLAAALSVVSRERHVCVWRVYFFCITAHLQLAQSTLVNSTCLVCFSYERVPVSSVCVCVCA